MQCWCLACLVGMDICVCVCGFWWCWRGNAGCPKLVLPLIWSRYRIEQQPVVGSVLGVCAELSVVMGHS